MPRRRQKIKILHVDDAAGLVRSFEAAAEYAEMKGFAMCKRGVHDSNE